jgi:fatty acid desaturase
MTEITTSKSRIYRLLEIKPSSNKIILLILPPVYSFWLFAVGKRLLEKQNKPHKTYTFFATMTIACFIFAYVISPLLLLIIPNLVVTGVRVLPLMYFIFFFFLGTLGMLTNITVKYDRLAKPDYYYSLVNSLDYVVRFVTLFCWPITIWSFQEKVNEYNE